MKKGSLGWGSLVCVAWLCLVFTDTLEGDTDARLLDVLVGHTVPH